jgi:hypothetical protein
VLQIEQIPRDRRNWIRTLSRFGEFRFLCDRHTNGIGELARIGGKSSRIGHLYDLTCDALVTVMLFVGMGIGAGATQIGALKLAPGVLGAVGCGGCPDLPVAHADRGNSRQGRHEAGVGGWLRD